MDNVRQILRLLRLIAGLNLLLALVGPFIATYAPSGTCTIAEAQVSTVAVSLLIFLLFYGLVLLGDLFLLRRTRIQSGLAYVGLIVACGMFLTGVGVGLLRMPPARASNHTFFELVEPTV